MVTLVAAAVLLVALDQSTKALAVSGALGRGGVSLGPIEIRPVLNHRAFPGPLRSPAALGALWVVLVAVLGAAVQLGPFFQSPVASVAIGAAVGGAGSNLVDRLWRHAVVDLVDLRVWPVFNLADVGIVVGAATALLYL
ncbi:MAG: signal peptidase II [Candidatus Rokuibacteriota bacterium]